MELRYLSYSGFVSWLQISLRLLKYEIEQRSVEGVAKGCGDGVVVMVMALKGVDEVTGLHVWTDWKLGAGI